MDPRLNIEILRNRADAANRRAQQFGPVIADPRADASARAPVPVTVRLATAGDGPAIVRIAELDSAQPPAPPLLLGERSERIVAALSLRDGAVVADPFVLSVDVVELLRLRAQQLRDGRPIHRLPLAVALLRLRRSEGAR